MFTRRVGGVAAPESKHRSLRDSQGAGESSLLSRRGGPGLTPQGGGGWTACVTACVRAREAPREWWVAVQEKGVSAGHFPCAPRLRRAGQELKARRPRRFSGALGCPHACMPACLHACVPWAMFMLCSARDRIDRPTQHCALIQNLSRSGNPEPVPFRLPPPDYPPTHPLARGSTARLHSSTQDSISALRRGTRTSQPESRPHQQVAA